MKIIDEILDKINFFSKTEKPLNDFSNWIFTISIGLLMFFLVKFKEVISLDCLFSNVIFIIVTAINMLNVLLAGITKYLMLSREIRMNQYIGEFNKKIFFKKDKEDVDFIKSEVETLLNSWVKEFNKIGKIGLLFNILIITTLISVLLSGIFVVGLLISQS